MTLLLYKNEFHNGDAKSTLATIFEDLAELIQKDEWNAAAIYAFDVINDINSTLDHSSEANQLNCIIDDKDYSSRYSDYFYYEDTAPAECLEAKNMTLEDWTRIDFMRKYFGFLFSAEFDINNLGSFMTRSLNLIDLIYDECRNDLKRKFHEAFTIKDKQLSLPDITYLYSLMDYHIISSLLDIDSKEKSYTPAPQSFYMWIPCSNNVFCMWFNLMIL